MRRIWTGCPPAPKIRLTLNRPEKMNAYTGQMGEELGAALDRADADDAVRVVIFTGAGRGFWGPFDFGAESDGSYLPGERALARGLLEGHVQVLVTTWVSVGLPSGR